MDNQQRKLKNEELLKARNIPYIDHLPMIEAESEAKVRLASDIASRIIILTYLNYINEVPEGRDDVIDFLKSENLWNKVSPEEKLLFVKNLTKQEKVNITWRSEAVCMLLWSIGKCHIDPLETKEVNISDLVCLIPKFKQTTSDFINSANVRTTSEILDMSDLVYRLHWATRQERNGNSIETDLNDSVVMEWHHAINWITCYEDQEWDDITTDT